MQRADEHSDELKATVEPDNRDARETVVPLFSEEISVSKRVVPKSRVQVSRVTRQREELVDELLARYDLFVSLVSFFTPFHFLLIRLQQPRGPQ